MSEEGRKQFDEEIKRIKQMTSKEEIKDRINDYERARKMFEEIYNSKGKKYTKQRKEDAGMDAYVAKRKIEALQKRSKELEKS